MEKYMVNYLGYGRPAGLLIGIEALAGPESERRHPRPKLESHL